MLPEGLERVLEDDDGCDLDFHGRTHRNTPAVDSYMEVHDHWFTMLCDQFEDSGIVVSYKSPGVAATPEFPLDSGVRRLG